MIPRFRVLAVGVLAVAALAFAATAAAQHDTEPRTNNYHPLGESFEFGTLTIFVRGVPAAIVVPTFSA